MQDLPVLVVSKGFFIMSSLLNKKVTCGVYPPYDFSGTWCAWGGNGLNNKRKWHVLEVHEEHAISAKIAYHFRRWIIIIIIIPPILARSIWRRWSTWLPSRFISSVLHVIGRATTEGFTCLSLRWVDVHKLFRYTTCYWLLSADEHLFLRVLQCLTSSNQIRIIWLELELPLIRENFMGNFTFKFKFKFRKFWWWTDSFGDVTPRGVDCQQKAPTDSPATPVIHYLKCFYAQVMRNDIAVVHARRVGRQYRARSIATLSNGRGTDRYQWPRCMYSSWPWIPCQKARLLTISRQIPSWTTMK